MEPEFKTLLMANQLRFSGHESFQCRNLWLKKGFDFIHQGSGDFNNDEAVLSLGVGKNMTTSIRYWMDAIGLRSDKENLLTFDLPKKLLSDGGWDPYLKDIGSLWLLHYHLVKNNHASIYNLAFNYFRKLRTEFTKDQLVSFLKNKCLEEGESHAESTLETDVRVFLKTYVQPKTRSGKKNIEDQFSSLLMELNLVREVDDIINEKDEEKKQWYKIESSDQESLPVEIFLYSILDNERFGNSVSLQALLNAENSPGSIFMLHPDALVKKIEELTSFDEEIVYKEDAGIRELQFSSKFKPVDVLTTYYARS